MKKKSKTLLGSNKFLNYVLVVLFVVAGFLTTIIVGTGNKKEILTNSKNLKEGEYAPPAHHKDRIDNHNGTYTLSLDVEGAAKTETHPSKANVLIVYDLSGSMNAAADVSATGRYGANSSGTAIKLYTRTGTNAYNYQYTEITNDTTTGNVYYCNGSNGSCNSHAQYNGTRYLHIRGQKAEQVAHDFSAALLAKNEANPGLVEMALVTFSGPGQTNSTTSEDNAKLEQNWTNSASFANKFSGSGSSVNLTYGGGTNWEAAMRLAYTTVQDARKNVPTFVVFITDGAPTFRLTRQLTRYSGSGTCTTQNNGNPSTGCSFYGNGGTTYDDLINYRNTIDEVRNIGNYNNGTAEEPVATKMFGIYAFGNEGDLLDDLIYAAANNGNDRTPQTGSTSTQYDTAKATTATTNYYNASSSAALDQAMNDIFTNIANTLGVGSVSIDDGTTNKVTTSTGVAELLEVDESSYEYWLSMDAPNNTITRKNLLTGADIVISLTDNGNGTITASSDSFTADVTVEGTLKMGTFKYKWTEANELYNFAPPAAHLEDGSVKWDLNSLGTLLNGVTYTVTFDVYASQETYDLVTDFKNGVVDYSGAYTQDEYNALPATSQKYYTKDTDPESSTYNKYVLDPAIKKYLKKSGNDYTLATNTLATLTYTDTRNEGEGPQTKDYNELDPIPAVSSEMDVTKKWLNDLDRRSAASETVDLYLLKDGKRIIISGTEENPTYEKITVNEGNEWYNSKFISTGSLKTIKDANGNITGIKVLAKGHDYTLEEIGGITYHWELQIETVHPMLIDGVLNTLIEVPETDIPEAMNDANTTYCVYNGHTFYKINGKVYYLRAAGVANLFAYNNRKSTLDVKKVVTGDAPAGKKFNFQYKVHNVGDKEVWFSVQDEQGNTIKDLEVSSNVTAEAGETGFYYVTNSDTEDQVFTVKLQDGWDLRFINLGTGSTYEITELALDDPFVIEDIEATTIVSSTRILPVGAVQQADGTYKYGNTIYTEKEGTDSEGTIYTYYEFTYTADINKQNRKVTGTVVAPNTSYQVTYTNNYPKTKLVVNKKWFKTIGSSIRVQLYADDEAAEDEDGDPVYATLSADNNWTYTFENLPVKKDGKVISYSAKEVKEEGFNYKDTYKGTENIVISASDIPEGTTEVKATVSIAGEDQEVTLNADNDWTVTLTGIEYINKDGSLKTVTIESTSSATISYAFTERAVEVTNSELTTATVTKVWDDANNQDGIRPGSVTVELYADGEATGKTGTITAPAGATGTVNTWTYTFEGLDKYNADGSEIVYTFFETVVPANYTKTPAEGTATTITNKHTPEVIDIPVEKQWDDANNYEGLRPTEITIALMDGTTEVGTVTLNAGNSWKGTFEDLPKYRSGSVGEVINYTVKEYKNSNYTTTMAGDKDTGFTIKNSRQVEKTSVKVTKVWQDNNDQDGLRKNGTKATFNLLADGTATGQTYTTQTLENTEEYTFTDLDVYKAGKKIVYTVTENAITGYTTTSSGDATSGFTFTNKHTPELIDIPVEKKWEDSNNYEGLRPTTVTIKLMDGNTEVDSKTLNATGSWKATFEDLPKYRSGSVGEVINYTIQEVSVPNYTSKTTGTIANGFVVTNSREVEKTSVTVTKVWQDNNDQDGLRKNGAKAVFTLLADGTSTGKTYTMTEDGSYTFADLDVYKDGKKIVYTVTEADITGYTTTSSGNATDGFVFTNKHEPGKTSVKVKKIWNDANDQDGLRKNGAKAKFTLYANGKATDKTYETSADNDEYTFTGLDEFANGQKIIYTVVEEEIAGYTTTSSGNATDGFVFTNKHTPEVIDIPVEKQWDDANNYEGLRPTEITIALMDGNTEVGTVTLNADNSWKGTFEDLPKYRSGSVGEVINYTVKEYKNDNYTTTMTGDKDTGFTIKNSRQVEKTSVKVTKVWQDNEDQDGLRKNGAKAVFTLLADGESTGKTYTMTEDGSYTFADLDVYKDGKKISYTVTEADITGYTTTSSGNAADGYTFTNKHTPEEIDIPVEKKWEDSNNYEGLRPTEITIALMDGNTEVGTVTLNAGNNWKDTFEDLPKYRSGSVGEVINYTVKEYKNSNYTTTVSGSMSAGFKITNTREVEKTSVKVTKVWQDNNDQDGLRKAGAKAVFTLLADGTSTGKTYTMTEDGSYTFTDLDVYKAGKKIVYTVTEAAIDGYTTTSSGNATDGYTFTNKHTSEKTSVPITKVWSDNNNQDGLRNANTTVRVELYADGEATGNTIELSGDPAKNSYSSEFTGLEKYRDQGVEIVYTVKETVVPDGYNYSGDATKDNNYTITNTHETAKISIDVTKQWNDGQNQDGLRNDETTVTFQLYANGTAVEGKTVTLSKANDWTATFADLDKKANGADITYTVKETSTPEGYTASAVGNETATGTAGNNYTIINTHTPAKVDITVNKKWVDNDNQDGLRKPYTIKLTGTTADGRTITVENDTVELPASVLKHTWTGLPEYDHGSKITYTATETVVPEGYEESYSSDKLTITNTHNPKKDVVVVTKVWDDANNRDGKRPGSITLHLFADATEVTDVAQPTPVKEGNTWTYTYENLPVYRDGGQEIVYTVTEDDVTDYKGTPDGLTITNKHTPEKIEIPVTKQWVDNNNQDGKRTSITVELYADGTKYDSITLSTSDANKENANLWEGKFTDLPKYREGKVGEAIEYTIKEVADILEGENPLYTGTINGFDIVNTHVPSKKVIEGEKIWDDAKDQDAIRPGSITVNLLVNGEVIDSQEVSEATQWKYKFENLPEYENGKVIPYQIDEAAVPTGYSKTVDNYNITNKHVPEEVVISGTKSWEDADDQDGIRPDSITVKLMRGETVVDTQTATAEGGWTYTFKSQPKYDHSTTPIAYKVVEETVDGYEPVDQGEYNIKNIHEPETVTYIVSKTWDDEEDNDRIRPTSITVKLLANGEVKETVKLSDENDWEHTFGPLAKNKAGEEIDYTIEEEAVAGYKLITSKPKLINKTYTQVLTNKHTPEKTSINGTKTWVDENNKAGKRPKTITVYVYADGVKFAEIVVSADTNWEYELKGLYKFKEGQEIVYSIEELPVTDYETTYNGFDITNTITEVESEEEETPPDTYAENEATYKVEYLTMLIGAFVITTLRRVVKVK